MSLMKKYSTEQDSLESQVSEIQEKLEQTKASSAHIGRFIRLIKKYKQPTELTKDMACELIDKIVVHEATGKKPNRQQQVDIYYNFIGQFDLPLSEKEIAEVRQKAEQEAAEKAKRKKNRQRESNVAHQAKAKAERWAANDGHMSGEELLVAQDCSVIDAILKKEEKSSLYAAVAKLSPAEINLMTSLYLCDDPIGQREYARRHGVAVTTINHQLTVALKKLKKMLPN